MRAPSTRRPDRPQLAASLGPARLTLAFAAVAVAVVTSVASYFSSVEGAEWLSAVSWTAATGFATAGLAYGARRIDRPHGRRAWTLLAVASGAWFAGQVFWDIWIVLDITPATPGIWDLAWIAFAVLGMVALTRFAPFPHASRASRLSTAADLAAVYSILTALSVLVFYEAAAESSLSLIGKLTSLAYAPMYVALAFTLAQALLGRGVLRLHPKLIALAIGTILTAVAFVLWTPEALSGAYVPGSSPTDAFWTVGGIFLGIAGLLAAGGDPVGLPDKTFLRRRAVVPTAAFVGGLLLLPVLVIWDERQGGVLVMLCGVIAAGLGLALRLGLVARGERQAERKAEEARNELDRFFSSAGDLLAVIGLDGSIRRSNPALERLTGYTSDEVIGSSIAQYIHEEDIRLGAEALERLRQGAASVEWENRLRTRDGEFVPVRWNATAAPEHGVAYTVGLDLRAARRAEAALREAHAQAVQASRLKSDFVANMSHEIRTPLNGVIGMTDLLRHTELTPEQEEYTELIRASGDALLSVINDILDFSKIEAGKLEITRGDFNVRETVDDVWAVVAAAAGVKGLELVSAIDDAVPDWAWGDGARVRQVLLNLVTNAVKFTSEGEIVIRASRERRGDGAAWLRLAVSDTGIGIAPEAVDRLFDAFEQADSSTTRKYGGTGLGLAISRQLVELMGGEIAVTSEPGSGSTFSFHLPLEPARGGVPATPVPDLADRRALVVDDNETNRTILARQLTSWHTRCDVAASGHEALGMLSQAAAAGDPYEIVLLDFNMPGLSGVDVARAVTANPVLGRARIVLLSSSTQRREAEQAGVHGHLTKPVSRARLRREICRVIGERPADAAEEAPAPAERSAEVDGGNRRILVVEDHVVNQRVAVSLLERRGFRVDVAGNGLEALDHHARTDYDAIFMDCQMPEMDGYEATVELRRREGRGRRTPIVAMTAHALSGDRERCLAVGMDDYISKPLRPEDFDAALARVVGSEPPVEAGEPVAPDGNGARELPVLDWEALADVVAGDYELRERLVELFVEQGERALAELDAAVAEGDAEGVKKLAHGLKGSSATMAARRLAAISEQLYRTGLGDELAPAAPRLLAELHEAFARTSDALRSVRR